MTERFSVAMATYNGERFLAAQLESLAGQTLPPCELVVCDDGSTDGTVDVLRGFARTAPFPVRIHRNERNLGYGDNFLKAVSLCEGEWIALCDQDDVWLSHKLARYAEVLARHPRVDLVSHSAEQVDEELKPLPHRVPNHRRFSVAEPLGNFPFSALPGFSCCVRRALLDALPPAQRPAGVYPLGRREPHDVFLCHIVNTYGRVARLPESLALYRRHATAATGQHDGPVFDLGVRARLRAGSYADAAGYHRMAERAAERQGFYQEVLDASGGADEAFRSSTRAAIAYYGRLAAAFAARGRIYERDAGVGARARAFADSLRGGAYTSSRAGRGLGSRALLKDAARVLVRW